MGLPAHKNCTVAIIGLGYVGLPLAVEFAKRQNCVRTGETLTRKVIGFDINKERLAELRDGLDKSNEITKDELDQAIYLELTNDTSLLATADIFVVTVPTPIDRSKRPDLKPLEMASSTVGKALQERAKSRLSKGNLSIPVIVYESTVYPGATEEVCVPILESESGLAFNKIDSSKGFVCGYSPERINPGDKEHRLTTITKVTSGSTPEAAQWVDDFYGSIVKAGTFKAPSIKVAEAAKVIENTQRDLNIALANELAIIFRRQGIDTLDVLETAGTKWNFLPFRPGLVGGHCIGVDPYYLTYKAEQLGYHPQVVLAGRRINDGMGVWIVEQLVLSMARQGLIIGGTKVLILGLSFKENCPDLRNTKVIDVIQALRSYAMEPIIVDPWIDPLAAKHEYGLEVLKEIPFGPKYKAIIAAVAHWQFAQMPSEQWQLMIDEQSLLIDLKGMVPRELEPIRL